MHELTTAAELSRLIGLIYDCAIDPKRWPDTLAEIHRALGFATASLSLIELPSGRLLLQISSGIESPWLERMSDYETEILDLWGGPEVIQTYPLDRPAVVSRANPAALVEPMNPYVRDWSLPQGLIDSLAIPLARDATAVGSLAMGRHHDAGPIGEREIALAQLLLPHLQRAAAINRLIEARTAAADQFAAVLDALVTPVVVVAADRAILHANRAARALLDAGWLLTARDGVLSAALPRLTRELAQAISGVDAAAGAAGSGARMIPVRDERGVHTLHVLPLRHGPNQMRLVREAAAAVFVASPQARPEGVGRTAAAVFGLTPAETRVLEGIAAGRTPAEVARELGVAPSTVHTHLLRLFAKTGVRRQVELVQLAAALAVPLGAPAAIAPSDAGSARRTAHGPGEDA